LHSGQAANKSDGMTAVAFEFAPMGKSLARNPYRIYEKMRAAGRVLTPSWGGTVVHRYEDVREVHLDHDRFSMSAADAGAMAMMQSGAGPGDAGGMEGDEFLMAQTMLTADPPDHERLRRVVNRAFTPRSITDLEPRVREICRDLLAPLAKGEPFDVVADFAAPLPTIVIAELLGIPAEDGHKFRMWTEAITGTDVRGRSDASRVASFGTELRRYLNDQIQQRKTAPTDDLIGRMVAANEEQIVSDAEVVAACVLLLIAGNETTMRLITNMTLALGRHPDQLDLVADDHELLPDAVEETLRFESPVHMLFRGVKQDTQVGGAELRKGQAILTMLAAANRDPDAFERADTYDVTRTDNLHVAFGHGIHYCLGAPLARRETRIAFEELLATVPRYEVVTRDEDLEYPEMVMLRSPRSLVIRLVG
jgi:cytochrome P450